VNTQVLRTESPISAMTQGRTKPAAMESELASRSLHRGQRAMIPWLSIFALMFVCLQGCGQSEDEKSEKQPGESAETKGVAKPIDSASHILAVADLDKFQPGRSRRAILEDLHWPIGYVAMAECDGKAICSISYEVMANGSRDDRATVEFEAIFLDNEFVAFVTRSPFGPLPWPSMAGDCNWLEWALETAPVSIVDLREEANSATTPPTQVDWGLTIAWLLLKPALRSQIPKPPTEDDYRRNAALRDQFNAARLDIDMTESEVESVLKVKPLEQGRLNIGSYKIYGSIESFNIEAWHHFWNVLVVYRNGKAAAVYSIGRIDEWRHTWAEESTGEQDSRK
jgi:hypothetical protein